MTKADRRARKRENQAKARATAAIAAQRQGRIRAIRYASILIAVIVIIGFGVAWVLSRDDDPKINTTGQSAPDTTSANPDVSSTSVAPVPTTTTTDPNVTTTTQFSEPRLQVGPTYTAVIKTNKGTIEVELDVIAAPVAASHFAALAREGFYDGLTFHRVIEDFMIQGGDPNGDGTGGSGREVDGEVPTDNYPVGSLAAAKTSADPAGTFDAQFFIVTGSQGASLPNDYARFGKVTKGIEIATAIAKLQDKPADTPTEKITITSITIVETPLDAAP